MTQRVRSRILSILDKKEKNIVNPNHTGQLWEHEKLKKKKRNNHRRSWAGLYRWTEWDDPSLGHVHLPWSAGSFLDALRTSDVDVAPL